MKNLPNGLRSYPFILNLLNRIKTGTPLTVTLKTRLALNLEDFFNSEFSTGIPELDQAWNDRRFVHGMTSKELDIVLKKLKVNRKAFNKDFTGNTYVLDESGEVLHYLCDIVNSIGYVKNKKPYVMD